MRAFSAPLILLFVGALGACRQAPPDDVAASGSGASAPAGDEPGDLLVVGPHFTAVAASAVSRGEREAADIYDGCLGLIGASPNHTIRVQGEQPLTLTVTPHGRGFLDLTLVVIGPDGVARCSDDGETLDPVIAEVWAEGDHDVYVGVRTPDAAPYDLSLRQGIDTPGGFALGSAFPAPVLEGDPPEPMDGGNHGGLRIGPGTGVATLEGLSGGTLRALDMGAECAGWIAPSPDHLLEITAPEELTLRVRSAVDTTLVARGPNDAIFCRDDDEGLDPVLRQVFVPGTWQVWVGSYDPQVTEPYRLTVSR